MGSADSASTGDGVPDVEGVVSLDVGLAFCGSIASSIILSSLADMSLLLLSAVIGKVGMACGSGGVAYEHSVCSA